ncbi:pyrroline-5-carboxylate reductase [Sphingomonas koreensis]|nr:pyrroline-5-carboxylate reductase [Sphingomonas koreensis]
MITGVLKSIWLIGCGNMAGAMLQRWVASGDVDPASVTVIDPGTPKLPDGVRHLTQISDARAPEAVMLGVKPQMLDDVAPALAPRIAGAKLLLSILAGVEVASLAKRFDVGAIVRVMPNLPVAIGHGAVGLYGVDPAGDAGKAATALMASLGLVEWIADEAQLDAVTALSGSGPGFVYRFIDALAAAGASIGLPDDQALRLATATVEGAAMMAAAAEASPATLADRVASPGGSTRKGLDVLDSGDALTRLLAETLTAARDRNVEMAAAAR